MYDILTEYCMEIYIDDRLLREYSLVGAPVKSLKASCMVPLTIEWYDP
jgi:hypothetical protein